MTATTPHAPPAERVKDLPRMVEAMALAVREAVLRPKRAGNPIAVWQNGQVVWLQPEDTPDSIDP